MLPVPLRYRRIHRVVVWSSSNVGVVRLWSDQHLTAILSSFAAYVQSQVHQMSPLVCRDIRQDPVNDDSEQECPLLVELASASWPLDWLRCLSCPVSWVGEEG